MDFDPAIFLGAQNRKYDCYRRNKHNTMSSVGKGWGRGIENFDFSYLIYWRKQGRGIENWGIENWDFSIPFSYTDYET